MIFFLIFPRKYGLIDQRRVNASSIYISKQQKC